MKLTSFLKIIKFLLKSIENFELQFSMHNKIIALKMQTFVLSGKYSGIYSKKSI